MQKKQYPVIISRFINVRAAVKSIVKNVVEAPARDAGHRNQEKSEKYMQDN